MLPRSRLPQVPARTATEQTTTRPEAGWSLPSKDASQATIAVSPERESTKYERRMAGSTVALTNGRLHVPSSRPLGRRASVSRRAIGVGPAPASACADAAYWAKDRFGRFEPRGAGCRDPAARRSKRWSVVPALWLRSLPPCGARHNRREFDSILLVTRVEGRRFRRAIQRTSHRHPCSKGHRAVRVHRSE